jgi:hypothetical protein
MKESAPRYLIPLVASPLLAAIWWALEHLASGQTWWRSIPFGGVSLLLLAFGAGMLAQDWYSSPSWLRAKWRRIRLLFEVERVYTALRTTPEKEWLALEARLRFIRAASRVRLVISATSAMDFPHARHDFVVDARDYECIEKDQRETFVLAILPLKRSDGKPPGYQAWGSRYRESGDVEGMNPLADGTRNAVTFEARAGWRKQLDRVPFAVIDKEPAKARVLVL